MTEPKPPKTRRRRWYSPSLRGLMVAVLVVGGFMGWKARQASIQRRAVAAIVAMGGAISYASEEEGPKWLRRLIGDDYFQTLVYISLNVPSGPDAVPSGDWLGPVLALDKLKYLEVGWRITDADLARLARLRRLRELTLTNAAISDGGMAHLGTLDRLESLVLKLVPGSGPEVTGAGLAHLAKLGRLESLTIYRATRFDDPNDLAPLGKLTGLWELDLDCSPRDDACLDHLRGLNQLAYLRLRTTHLTDAGMARLARMGHDFASLVFVGESITDAGLAILAPQPQFSRLDFGPLPKVTDVGLARLGAFPTLFEIDLSRSAVTDAGLVQLARLPNLNRVLLTDTAITDAGLVHLPTLANLDHLDLSGTRITDAGLVHFAGLPKIITLKLARTAITDAGLASLAKLTSLRSLSVRGTGVTPAGVATLRAARPGLKIHAGPFNP